jgi:hypothetical protein
VDVIRHSPDADALHLVFACDPAHKAPNSIFNVVSDSGFTIFGAEDDVIVQGGIGVGHAGNNIGLSPFLQRSLRDRIDCRRLVPGLESPGYQQGLALRGSQYMPHI